MKKWKEVTLVVLIGILSILTLLSNLDFENIPQLIVSAIGLACLILYFAKKDIAYLFIKVWIIAQLPFIGYESTKTVTEGVEQTTTLTIYDAAQLLDFHLDLVLNNLTLGLNVFPMIFLGLYRILKSK